MSLPRLLRSPCARAISKSAYKAQAAPLRQLYKPFSTSLRRHDQWTLEDDAASKLPGIDPSICEVTNTITPKALVANQDLVFGRTFTGESYTISVALEYSILTQSCQTTCYQLNGQLLRAGWPLA